MFHQLSLIFFICVKDFVYFIVFYGTLIIAWIFVDFNLKTKIYILCYGGNYNFIQ